MGGENEKNRLVNREDFSLSAESMYLRAKKSWIPFPPTTIS